MLVRLLNSNLKSTAKFLNASSQVWVHLFFCNQFISDTKRLQKSIQFQYVILRCNINLQEYQSKEILKDNNVNVQRFLMASTPVEAQQAGKQLSMYTPKKPHYVFSIA